MKTILLLMVLHSSVLFAGQTGGGGGLGKQQLHDIALSETIVTLSTMRELLGGELGTSHIEPHRLMESSTTEGTGIYITVKPEDLENLAAEVAQGRSFVYHGAEVRAAAISQDVRMVIMHLTDDSNAVIVVGSE